MSEKQPEQLGFEEELRRYARADPFIPFDIVTTSGDRYEIHESLQLAMTTAGSAIVLALPRTGIRVIRKNQIVAVHVHEPTV